MMAYKAADDLLGLMNLIFKNKTLYLTKRRNNTLTVIQSIKNDNNIDFKEGDTRKLEDAY